jgi:hypothetical protein
LGINVSGNANAVYLKTQNPETINDIKGKPDDFLYGLIHVEIKVVSPGDAAAVTFFFPEPVSERYHWYKYDASQGWSDFNPHSLFNDDRTQITLTLIDGGIGDADGEANGIIDDPSGLGQIIKNTDGGGDGGDGCFITTLN